MNVAVGLVDAVAGVEDDVVLVGVDEGADGVACVGVVPAVGAEEDDLHVASPNDSRLILIVSYRIFLFSVLWVFC